MMTRTMTVFAMGLAAACSKRDPHKEPPTMQPGDGNVIAVGTPKRDNLQYVSFWVAVGEGLFAKHGVEVRLEPGSAGTPSSTRLERGEIDAAVLPPPRYLELVANKAPIVVVANLLANDGIALVVQGELARSRGITRELSLVQRLRKLHGLRVGVAAGPPTRLRTLFASQGLDADNEITLVTLKGDPQNVEFGAGRVDALYVHSPYLERALLDQGGVMIVDQQSGEVAELADRQIHALVVSRRLIEQRPVLVGNMVAAIADAEALIHRDRARAIQAVLHQFPDMDRVHVAKLVEVYEPAVPKTPFVSVDGFRKALRLFPAQHAAPDLTGVDLSAYVDNRFAQAAAP